MRPSEEGGCFLPPRQPLTPGPASPLLPRLAAQFAAAVADGSRLFDVPGYRVHIWPSPDPFYRNVAIPVARSCSQPTAVDAMVRQFTGCGRSPSVEYFAELWPELATALTARGLVLDTSAQAMVATTPAAWLGEKGPARLLTATGAPGLLRAFLAGAAAVFGERAALLAPGELERFAAGLRRGTLLAAAVLEGCQPVAGASLIRTGGTGELVGVWTHPDQRRRGLARACCRLLLHQFFGHGGDLAWLSAHGPEAGGLYRELNFRVCGTQLNFIGPAVP